MSGLTGLNKRAHLI